MNIEINGETERLIQAALASGKYISAEEFVAAMAKQELRSGLDGELPGELPNHIDIEELAASQGVGPVEDFRDLAVDFWPKDESVDDFIGEIRSLRKNGPPRIR